MEDDYRYVQKQLPPITPIGGENFSASEVARVSFDDIGNPVVGIPQEQSPYSNPDFTGGGGGGGGTAPTTCATTSDIGTINTSAINYPCDSPTGGISSTGITFLDSITLTTNAVEASSVSIEIRELDVCHMGQAGKRQFFCGEAYAA